MLNKIPTVGEEVTFNVYMDTLRNGLEISPGYVGTILSIEDGKAEIEVVISDRAGNDPDASEIADVVYVDVDEFVDHIEGYVWID